MYRTHHSDPLEGYVMLNVNLEFFFAEAGPIDVELIEAAAELMDNVHLLLAVEW